MNFMVRPLRELLQKTLSGEIGSSREAMEGFLEGVTEDCNLKDVLGVDLAPREERAHDEWEQLGLRPSRSVDSWWLRAPRVAGTKQWRGRGVG